MIEEKNIVPLERCHWCGTDLSEEMARIDQWSRPHTSERCREYLKAALRAAEAVNVPEAQRGTVQVKLRLPPDVADDLDDLAERLRLTRSGTVAWLLEQCSTPSVGTEESKR